MHRGKSIPFLLLFVFFSIYGLAQETAVPRYKDSLIRFRRTEFPPNDPIFSLKTDKDRRYWGFTAALVNGISSYTEFELGASKFYCPRGMQEIIYLSVSNEFVPNASVFNPKVSAGISWYLFAARFCIIDYNTNLKTEIYILHPEIGFSFIGIINFFYGQDIQLNNFENKRIRPFGWTIEFNIPFAPKGSLPLGF